MGRFIIENYVNEQSFLCRAIAFYGNWRRSRNCNPVSDISSRRLGLHLKAHIHSLATLLGPVFCKAGENSPTTQTKGNECTVPKLMNL
jgi:hypothetical protein